MPLRQTLSLPDIQLSYLEWNQGQEPLLLLHGLADHALVWSSLGDYLANRYHIIAPDMRGHGESSKPENNYTFDCAIADLEALMNHVGWSSAHIIGHSWTGKLAAIWARENPKRLRSMILVDPIFI
ncbi:MAG TPA: alpha/beta hydrolase, partial [Cyanobacteria bacterium UBA12227]|nr:alpha/beta hydrolase [Cyanobacteria bacterium UBA12227]